MTTVPVPSPELTVGRQGHYAGAVSRLVAFAADVGASWGVYTLGVVLVNAALKLVTGHTYTFGQDKILSFFALAIWEFVYYAYQWAVSGKTLGMAILGVQVVNRQGGPITTRQAVIRTLGLGLCLLLLGIPFLGIIFQQRTTRPRRFPGRYRGRLRLGRPGGPAALDGPPGGGRTSRSRAQGAGGLGLRGFPFAHLRCGACRSPKSAGRTPMSPWSRSTGRNA